MLQLGGGRGRRVRRGDLLDVRVGRGRLGPLLDAEGLVEGASQLQETKNARYGQPDSAASQTRAWPRPHRWSEPGPAAPEPSLRYPWLPTTTPGGTAVTPHQLAPLSRTRVPGQAPPRPPPKLVPTRGHRGTAPAPCSIGKGRLHPRGHPTAANPASGALGTELGTHPKPLLSVLLEG